MYVKTFKPGIWPGFLKFLCSESVSVVCMPIPKVIHVNGNFMTVSTVNLHNSSTCTISCLVTKCVIETCLRRLR